MKYSTALFLTTILQGTAFASPSGAAARNVQREAFSFESWVEGIIADPDGDHLSPEKAVQAAKDSGFHTEANSHCNNPPENPVANSNDAVTCINILAATGGKVYDVTSVTRFCKHGHAVIIGASVSGDIKTTGQDIARTAGKVMDLCYRSDNTVEGNYPSFAHPKMLITVLGPS